VHELTAEPVPPILDGIGFMAGVGGKGGWAWIFILYVAVHARVALLTTIADVPRHIVLRSIGKDYSQSSLESSPSSSSLIIPLLANGSLLKNANGSLSDWRLTVPR